MERLVITCLILVLMPLSPRNLLLLSPDLFMKEVVIELMLTRVTTGLSIVHCLITGRSMRVLC